MNKSPEHELQKRCVTWFKYQYPHLFRLFFAVPNGGTRNKAEAGKLKAEGARRGVADLILLLPNYYFHSLNIEMKAGSQQSEEQKLYEIWCKSSRNKYIICKSFEQFQCEIKEYLETVDPNIMEDLKRVYNAQKESEIIKAREQYRKRIISRRKNHETK